MMKFKFSLQRLILGLLVFIAGALFMVGQIQAQECKENACEHGDTACWSQAKLDCQNKINETQTQAKTLKSTINLLNGQISLQQIQVNQTLSEIYQLETEINELSQRIEGLGYSLDRLGTVLIERVRAQYKQSRSAPSLRLLGAESLSELVNQVKYLALAQRQTTEVMEKTETQRLTYDEQKTLKEEKQAELTAKRQQLEAEKAVVTQKRAEQQALLDITNSSEQQYQDLLDQAQRELAALADSAFTGKKPVGKGEFIGLMGNTGFSKGAHLHLGYFNLTEDEHNGIFAGGIGWYSGRHIDPRGALQSRSLVSYDPSCPGQIGSGPGSWPLSDPYITQCYGVTPYSSVYSGNFHRGLDMSTKGSVAITAVEGGVAYFYRGATSFGNNVRVFHPDGKMTLYLHLQ